MHDRSGRLTAARARPPANIERQVIPLRLEHRIDPLQPAARTSVAVITD
ncbi:hypothetical protein PV416_00470 [Streptomyces ipomoeae]|jgi:hypothetical protein|nr:hypothetical protein [Streptomyces ipomoeae]MDX2819595.1 hypothetical protein [Streptomyces ipomoeae]MDX2872686.1 hypothetical protein [Streptomyces ipomoeae]